MKKVLFTGAGTALVTPFNADGSINFDAFGKLIEDQITRGIDALIVCGTTGEASAMTDGERLACIRFAVEKTAGRVPVIAGTGSNNTAHAVELSVEAEKLGVDGLLLVTPYYNKTTQAGLIAHFTAIAGSVKIPCIVYNVPSRTGMNIQPATYLALSKIENIVAAKEANGDLSSVAETLALCGDDLAIYSGNDDQIVPILSLGGKGVISVLSNVCPEDTHAMCTACFAGDYVTAAKLQLKYIPLIKALFCETNPIPAKGALNLLGFPAGPVRLPLVELSAKGTDSMKASLAGLGLLG